MSKKFYIETWGCQMNEEDSERLSGLLKKEGYEFTKSVKDAELIIYNTCCVRENAEQKVFGNIGILKKYKKDNPNLIIAVTGCMTQQKGMAEKIRNKFPYVDIIIGTFNSYKFVNYLNEVKESKNKITKIFENQTDIIEGIPLDRNSTIKAFVTIMYGCDNFCTYCVVPYVRGRERSRKPEDIEKEIKDLVAKGYKEVTLLGQNVNSYGKNLEPAMSFSQLIRRIDKIEGLERIRFMTSNPKDFTVELLESMKECPKVCEQVHLPVQSGSSKILKLMNRKYDREKYMELIGTIKENIKDVVITTDIIIGFPGETEEDFQETINLCKEVEFDSAFTFIYSKRQGTKAYEMDDLLTNDVKHDRFNRLMDTVNSLSIKKNKEYEGKIVEILVEGESKSNEMTLSGRTRGGKLVNFTGNPENIGKLVFVKIIEAKSFSLFGEEVQGD